MKIHTRIFMVILLISIFLLYSLSSDDQAEETATPVPQNEEEDDIKINFDILKKVGSDGKFIVPRIGPGPQIPSIEIPRNLPPTPTPGTIATSAPPKGPGINVPLPPVVIPGKKIRGIPKPPSITPSHTKSITGWPNQMQTPGPPPKKIGEENSILNTLPPSSNSLEIPIDTGIQENMPQIPIPVSITEKDSDIGSLALPKLPSEETPTNEGNETTSLDIPSLPRLNHQENTMDLNLPQDSTISEEYSPSTEIPQSEYTIPLKPDLEGARHDPSLQVPDNSMEEESPSAPHVEDNLPEAPRVIETNPPDIPQGNIPLPASPDDSSKAPKAEPITEIPLVETPAITDLDLPDLLPPLPKPTTETPEDIPSIEISTSEIEYKIIRDWKDRNLLYDGNFEAIPYLEKDAWFLENCSLKRVLKWNGDTTLAPKSGNQIGVVFGESQVETSLYQLINVETLAGLIDKGQITLKAILSASSLSKETEKVKLTILCWGINNDQGKILKKTSESIAVNMGDWEETNIHIEEIPPSTQLIQFHISIKNRSKSSEPLIALDAARMNLTIR